MGWMVFVSMSVVERQKRLESGRGLPFQLRTICAAKAGLGQAQHLLRSMCHRAAGDTAISAEADGVAIHLQTGVTPPTTYIISHHSDAGQAASDADAGVRGSADLFQKLDAVRRLACFAFEAAEPGSCQGAIPKPWLSSFPRNSSLSVGRRGTESRGRQKKSLANSVPGIEDYQRSRVLEAGGELRIRHIAKARFCSTATWLHNACGHRLWSRLNKVHMPCHANMVLMTICCTARVVFEDVGKFGSRQPSGTFFRPYHYPLNAETWVTHPL
ncbi:hypothetical protein B0T21DRAFT_148842 [Apiosordaria backusii]|uniref:Uncharacterized protein n=1 Tax=Apiosordaria backusii TaxID=314023 RepID=A0AA40BSZ6_9PEZI|nr:hypothetical protein B0T21DRAFT_148842 [Apiosordaria backusii]